MVTVALVGLGRIASLLEDDTKREKPATHAGAFSAVPDTRLVGGFDTDPDRRSLFSSRWEVPTDFPDVRKMLSSLRPDILVIATYPDSHAALVDLGCRSGVPVVVCEKPLTDTLAAARTLVRRVAQTPTRVVVNHERRYARDYLRVRELVRAGTYGKLVIVHAKLFMGRGRTPAEVLVWDGTHMVDILRFITGGEISTPRVWGRPLVPGGRLTARFLAGATEVFLETAADRDHLVFELDLGFERGRVRIGNGLYEESVGAPSPLYDKMRSLVPVAVDPGTLYPTGYFSGMAADAVRAVRDPGYQPASSLGDGLAALEALETLLRKSGASLMKVASLKY